MDNMGDTGLKVFVYWNLHRKLWSVRALQGPDKGRVVSHAYYVRLRDATGRVGKAGRERVLREGKKNVHAGMVGTLDYAGTGIADGRCLSWYSTDRVTYNPYRYDSFMHVPKHGSAPDTVFLGSAWAFMAPAAKVYIGDTRYG
jgi:hypothetical protein